ncbi:M42 family metallopeptidase [Deinococcus sp. MIMF12]|uniref:M42 family metallopeptidase n=1 Tax=Deinococcus rhizophilus TaxID=3049544 RepID=A0ABT7JG18_9DEIO|nr:M42 family metallopeptidase [Deinococcus rhizophilus]MDL2342619.1 M42 family metallopeptidase [Deinococcus rhizophilus]
MTQDNPAPSTPAAINEAPINEDFLFALLREAAPSGCERRAADVWKREAATFARVSEDHYGNVYAELGPEDGPTIALMGHLDEIGLIVSHVGDGGLISVLGVGGWDPQVLVGQRIRLLAPGGDILGVIGKKAIHVMEPEDRKNASKLEDLWIDVGLSKEEVQQRVPVGTYGVIEQGPIRVGEKIVARALDNRVGGFIVLEALRALKDADLKHRVVAVGTSQEEIGVFGAHVSGHRLNPVAGVAVDVTHETGQPGVSEKKYGTVPFGSGANLSVGPMTSPAILRQMQDAAREEGIPYTLSASGRYTGTDADALTLVRSGVPTAVVSIPNRYMHSPSEMVDARDVKACTDILAAWIRRLEGGEDFLR